MLCPFKASPVEIANHATPDGHKPRILISNFICPMTHPISHPHPFRNPEELLTSQQTRCFEVDANQQRFPSDPPATSGFIFMSFKGKGSLTSWYSMRLSGARLWAVSPQLHTSSPNNGVNVQTRRPPEPVTCRGRRLGWSCGSEQASRRTREVPSRARRSPGSARIFMS